MTNLLHLLHRVEHLTPPACVGRLLQVAGKNVAEQQELLSYVSLELTKINRTDIS